MLESFLEGCVDAIIYLWDGFWDSIIGWIMAALSALWGLIPEQWLPDFSPLVYVANGIAMIFPVRFACELVMLRFGIMLVLGVWRWVKQHIPTMA